jgi:hypothetical protein
MFTDPFERWRQFSRTAKAILNVAAKLNTGKLATQIMARSFSVFPTCSETSDRESSIGRRSLRLARYGRCRRVAWNDHWNRWDAALASLDRASLFESGEESKSV